MRFSVSTLCCLIILLSGHLCAQKSKYALVIGIKGYKGFPEKDSLKYADHDAIEFATFIQTDTGGGFLPQNVRCIINDSATRVGIDTNIAWLSRVSGSDDLVYIFFSGHGVADNLNFAYFMPYDGDKANPSALGFRVDRFFEDIQTRISYKHLVFFADACHAGSVYSEGRIKGHHDLTANVQMAWDNLFKNQEEITMSFLSSSSNQFSLEDDTLHHGIFTYYLLEGLRGKANSKQDSIITANEIYHYLSNKVSSHASMMGFKQTPTVSSTFDPDMPLALNLDDTRFERGVSNLNQGIRLYNDSNYIEAISKFQAFLKDYPTYSKANYLIGLCYVDLKSYNLAENYLKRAIENDSTNANAYYSLGWTYMQREKIENAKSAFHNVLNYAPKDVYTLQMLAYIYDSYKPYDWDTAYYYAHQAYLIKPNDLNILNCMMVCSFRAGYPKVSVDIAEQLRQNIEKRYNVKDIRDLKGEYDEHAYYLNSCINSMAYYLLDDNVTEFENSYNLFMELYNQQWNFNDDFKFTGPKHHVLGTLEIEQDEKKLLLNLYFLMSNPKSSDVISEYIIKLPPRYDHLLKPKIE